MKEKISLFGLAALLVAGCGEKQHDSLTLAEANDSDVIVNVNGQDVKWGELRERIDYDYQLFYLKNKRRTPDATNAVYVGFCPKHLNSAWSALINLTLVRDAAKKAKVTVRTNYLEEVSRKLIDIVSGCANDKSVTNLANVARTLDVDEKFVEELIKSDALCKSFFVAIDPRIEMTDEELAAGRQRIADFNSWAAESNKVHLARLADLKQRALSGGDFGKLAEENSQVRPKDGVYWDAYNWDEIKEEDLKKWAFSAKVGDVGGPFSLGDGYSIVKLIKKEEGALRLSAVAKTVARVYLARITMFAFDPYPEISDADLRRTMSNGYLEMAQKQFFEKSHAEMRIYYPNGTNLFSRLPGWFSDVPRIARKNL